MLYKVARGSYLERGKYSVWTWHSGERKVASIGCVSYGDYVTLIYTYGHGEATEEVRQDVQVLWTPCNYDGQRAWWQCPSCRRRVAVIYGAGKYFACRHCYRLCYAAQKENAADRALRRAEKIRRRLGQQHGGIVADFPDKPKGMHWETYDELVERCADYELASWAVLGKWLDCMESQGRNKIEKGERKHGD